MYEDSSQPLMWLLYPLVGAKLKLEELAAAKEKKATQQFNLITGSQIHFLNYIMCFLFVLVAIKFLIISGGVSSTWENKIPGI